MERGFHDLAPGLWRDFVPRLDIENQTGNAPPVLGTGSSIAGQSTGAGGRYLYLPERRLCVYDFSFTFGDVGNAAGTPGSGQLGGYLVELPIPAASQMGGQGTPISPAGVGGGDRPLGSGWVCRGSAFGPVFPHVTGAWSLADTNSKTFGGLRNSWCQMFLPTVIFSGTGTVPVTATSLAIAWPFSVFSAPLAAEVTVTWTGSPSSYQTGTGTLTTASQAITFGTALVNAPAASDILIQFTGSDTKTGQLGSPWLTNVGTTGFTVNVDVAPTTAAPFSWTLIDKNGNPTVGSITTTGATVSLTQSPAAAAAFSYQVCSYEAVIMGAQAPFNVGASEFDTIAGSLVYETAA